MDLDKRDFVGEEAEQLKAKVRAALPKEKGYELYFLGPLTGGNEVEF